MALRRRGHTVPFVAARGHVELMEVPALKGAVQRLRLSKRHRLSVASGMAGGRRDLRMSERDVEAVKCVSTPDIDVNAADMEAAPLCTARRTGPYRRLPDVDGPQARISKRAIWAAATTVNGADEGPDLDSAGPGRVGWFAWACSRRSLTRTQKSLWSSDARKRYDDPRADVIDLPHQA